MSTLELILEDCGVASEMRAATLGRDIHYRRVSSEYIESSNSVSVGYLSSVVITILVYTQNQVYEGNTNISTW